MDITGTYTFHAPPERVWNLLMDPDAIASCIPGCDGFEPDGEDRYRAKLTVAMSAITGTYEGTVAITERQPPTSYRLHVEGQGKAGFVKGDVTIILRAEGAGTVVDLKGTVQTGGVIARLGQRLIANVSTMMQDRFFACMREKV
jgi:carbon monoxide dehydrogenase subunit G